MADSEKVPFLRRMFDHLAGTEAGKARLDAVAKGLATKSGVGDSAIDGIRNKLRENPLKLKTPIFDEGVELPKDFKNSMSPLANTGGLLWENMKANPGAAIGTGLLGAGNIAGLVDNDKILGQAIGAGLGTAAGLAIKPLAGWGPLGVVNSAMIGGNLGSLFDILSAKREKEQQDAMMYQQQYV